MLLRPYEPSDEAALASLWYESWRSIGLTKPVVTKAELLARVPREISGRWTVTVAEVDGRIVGFLALALAEQRIDQLFVAPGHQGHGVGAALFGIAVDRMPRGFWLSTQPDNHAARAFYERRGMSLDRIEQGPGGERAFYVLPSPAG